MLRYMNRGTRAGPSAHPVGLRRNNWEFLAVVHGRIRPVFPNRPAPAYQARRLWLMPPESPHSWITPPRTTCEVLVFHFASIHPLLESSLPASRELSIPLPSSEVRLLTALFQELCPHYQSPRLSSAAYFEAAMLRLCTLFLARDRSIARIAAFDDGADKVFQAMQWQRRHLADGVRVNDVAAAVSISPGHLRRLFLRIRGESPKRVFMRSTIEEACRLMAEGALSLKEVSARCGFSGFSEFYRAFRNHTGQSPSTWRSNRLYRGLGIDTSGRRQAPSVAMCIPAGRDHDPASGIS